ncbi:hypothetical protein CspHIS471_0401450 [Cutaneotrichosporon sp. HIS471]|nr:hypothetical protein CspHIS471_0401450 [Cutaneotrichosporon sp. HIS471]
MSSLDEFYDDLDDDQLIDMDDEGSEYVDALDALFNMSDDEDEGEDEDEDEDEDDPDVHMDESEGDSEEDDEDEERTGVYIVERDSDDSEQGLELRIDPSNPGHVMEILSLLRLHAGNTEQAQLSLRRLVGMPRENRRKRKWWKPQVEPHPAGLALLRSGDFGPVGPPRSKGHIRPGAPLKREASAIEDTAAALAAVDPGIEEEKEEDGGLPNGGYGWVIVLCILGLNACTWGVNTTYGVFSAYFLQNDYYGGTQLDYSWVGGLSAAIAVFQGPFVNWMVRRFGFKTPLYIGAVCVGLGQCMAGVATSFAGYI